MGAGAAALRPVVQSHGRSPPTSLRSLSRWRLSLRLLPPQRTWPEGGAAASEAAQPWMRQHIPGMAQGTERTRMSLPQREGAMVYEEPDLPHLTPPPPCRLDADSSTLQMRKLWLRKVQRFAEGHWAGLRVDIGTSSSNRELAGALTMPGLAHTGSAGRPGPWARRTHILSDSKLETCPVAPPVGGHTGDAGGPRRKVLLAPLCNRLRGKGQSRVSQLRKHSPPRKG